VNDREVANRIAAAYSGRSVQGYARWKVRFDPIYAGVLGALRNVTTPILDVGCGLGLLAFYLREHGLTTPIVGIDFDARKIALAQQASTVFRDVTFRVGDAREPLPAGHTVVLLDILHYFDTASQQQILANAAQATPPGGMVVLRQGLHDSSWRHRVTAWVDAAGRLIRWMRAETLNYPTREAILAAFDGFDVDVRPFWGKTPYNNYLFILRRR
jgi:2-polyprenyl-3-methyl-5-hydroxy-6-metoxy-1,4-benzoquinol methylase